MMKLKQIFDRIAAENHVTHDELEKKFEDFVADKLLKSETLAKAFKIKESEMEELYSEAYGAYVKDLYDEAGSLFRWLAIFNPFETKYWMGVGACQQLQGNYEKALHGYAMAGYLNTLDPYPHYHAYECYTALGNAREAQIALEDAEKRAVGEHYVCLRRELQKGKKYA